MAKKLEKSQWSVYFDLISKALTGKRAEVEVASLKIGDQIEAEWLPFFGISYDPKDDVIALALEGHDHLIHKPEKYTSKEKVWNCPASRLSTRTACIRSSSSEIL